MTPRIKHQITRKKNENGSVTLAIVGVTVLDMTKFQELQGSDFVRWLTFSEEAEIKHSDEAANDILMAALANLDA